MKRVSRGLCVLAAINIRSATTCLLAASYLGSLIQIEPYPERLEPAAALAPLRQNDLGQPPPLPAAPSGGGMTASNFIASAGRWQ